jgi:hypothetical protein
MYGSEILKFIHVFNAAAVGLAVFLAACGIFVIVCRIFKWNVLKGRMAFIKAFCVAALAALAAEATAFNLPAYLRYFSGTPLRTLTIPADNPKVIRLSDGNSAEIFEKTEDNKLLRGIRFTNLDTKVTSIHANLEYINTDRAVMAVRWKDEAETFEFIKVLHKDMPHENYTPLQPSGKVSELSLIFTGTGGANANVSVVEISLNKNIPFYFSGLRLLVVSFLLFALLCLVNKKLRAKAAYCLFELKFNPADIKQNIAYASVAFSLMLFSAICAYTSAPISDPMSEAYNKYLVDALIAGRTYLDYGNPELLLIAEHPYIISWLDDNGYKRNVHYMFDWSWYKGKYYVYFGVVPAAVLYVPYKLITGNYMSDQAGVLLFMLAAIVSMAMLWRFLVIRYMPNARFAFCLLALPALFFASVLYPILRFPSFYTIVQAAAFAFVLAGILLLMKSVDGGEKVNRLKLFFACLCLALVVGCRPNMVFVSLLVPFVLWKHRSWKLLLLVAVPYILVAIPLCIYNYARFESITEFGGKYVLSTYPAINIVGSQDAPAAALRTVMSVISYLFLPNFYKLHFPFVEYAARADWITLGAVRYVDTGSGVINFPIAWCLLYMFNGAFIRNGVFGGDGAKTKIFRLSLAFLAVAAVLMFLTGWLSYFAARYMTDFAVLMIIPALLCAYCWSMGQNADFDIGSQDKNRLGVVYAMMAISIFVGLCLFATGPNPRVYTDPSLFRYLESSLGIIRGA